MTKRIGYARVSTSDQNIEMQLQALSAAGCDDIFTDQGLSGSLRSRPGLEQSLRRLQPGDTLVIWRLDRLGRSLSNLIEVVARLGRDKIGLYSITEAINTASAGGILIFHIMGALAEFERALISERTKAGMSAAKARGSPIGRPIKMAPEQIMQAIQAIESEGMTVTAAAKAFAVSRATLYRALYRAEASAHGRGLQAAGSTGETSRPAADDPSLSLQPRKGVVPEAETPTTSRPGTASSSSKAFAARGDGGSSGLRPPISRSG